MPLDAGPHVQAIAPRVLVADDQADIVTALQLLLRDAGLDADAAASIQGVRERLEAQSYDLLTASAAYLPQPVSSVMPIHRVDDAKPWVKRAKILDVPRDQPIVPHGERTDEHICDRTSAAATGAPGADVTCPRRKGGVSICQVERRRRLDTEADEELVQEPARPVEHGRELHVRHRGDRETVLHTSGEAVRGRLAEIGIVIGHIDQDARVDDDHQSSATRSSRIQSAVRRVARKRRANPRIARGSGRA
jgi:hypothetical protein